MYVSMFNGCPLWLCPRKGTASTEPRREVFQRSPIFPTARANPARNTPLAVMQPTLSRALRLVWQTMKMYPRTNSGPFTIEPSENWTGDPHFQGGKITKSSPRRTLCKLWVCFFDRELEGTGADAGNTTSASTASPTSKSSSKARLPYACITEYATTPPSPASCSFPSKTHQSWQMIESSRDLYRCICVLTCDS